MILPEVKPKTASMLNQIASTTAGILFASAYLFFFEAHISVLAGILVLGMLIDSATVPYVHSGVISERYKALKNSDLFLKIHVPPAIAAYGSMLLFLGLTAIGYRFDALFYFFIASWLVVYVSGVSAFIQLRRLDI